ncbi:hypothetical protein JYT16_00825 [Gemmatimonas aurantiaca]|nr:hypothetical protein [Gemmatimonas aurantiaca]
MNNKSQKTTAKENATLASTFPISETLRDRRTAALLDVKKALDLAEGLKLVSLNIAVASAQTQSENWDVRRLKTELAELTNQAIKSSKETSSLIEAIRGAAKDGESRAGAKSATNATAEFRRAIALRKQLDDLLGKCRVAVDSLAKIDGDYLDRNTNE